MQSAVMNRKTVKFIHAEVDRYNFDLNNISSPKQVTWKYRLKYMMYNVDDWNTIKLPERLYFMYFILRPFLHGLRLLKLVK